MVRPRGLAHLTRDWRQGRFYGYPVCCIAHFCWDGLFGWPSYVVRCKQIRSTHGNHAVPCGIFHSGDSPYGPIRRIARILWFQSWALQPTARGRVRLALARSGSPGWLDYEPEVGPAEANELPQLYWGNAWADWAE